MRSVRRCWVVVIALLALGAGRAAAQPIAFETPAVVDPIHTFGEPDVGVDPQGRVFSSGPAGTGTQGSVWLRSVDGGPTVRANSPGAAPDPIPGLNAPPRGGDPDIALAPDRTPVLSGPYAQR